MKTTFLVLAFICLLPLSAVAASSERDKAYVLIHGPKVIPYVAFCTESKSDSSDIVHLFIDWIQNNYIDAEAIGKIFFNALNDNTDDLIFILNDNISANTKILPESVKNKCPDIITQAQTIKNILQQE